MPKFGHFGPAIEMAGVDHAFVHAVTFGILGSEPQVATVIASDAIVTQEVKGLRDDDVVIIRQVGPFGVPNRALATHHDNQTLNVAGNGNESLQAGSELVPSRARFLALEVIDVRKTMKTSSLEMG